ncbi:MAG: hypothetical protein U5O16_37090 [Rhodococcus sp. (in: high G+C Gram-positive bacteria)]|uniref:DUF6924 domain-containing protein n=1 Tax=Rhodococcus sp. TaxID=1831 RepID=UPI002AD607AE|nr:hypothetical protein [Rhodococcus sp. (in: high G+C Gram-positive bacteria)]MDZ7917384.1 hypothetical protein [Rhodococcus sp. (in: high G+C Gram-positive bacteria)]
MDRQLPPGVSLLVRTDFSDDGLWQEVLLSTVDEEEEAPFFPQFTVVDDRQFENLAIDELLGLVGPDRSFIFLADSQTMTNPEHPLLLVDTGSAEYDSPGRTVRVTQPGIESVSSGLSLGNSDFISFIESADADGVYRGIEEFDPSQYDFFPIETLREAVAQRQDLPLFAELLHDLDTDDLGSEVTVISGLDIETFRSNVRNSPNDPGWPDEGKEEFLRAIEDVPEVAVVDLLAISRYAWTIALGNGRFEPIAAYRKVHTGSGLE